MRRCERTTIWCFQNSLRCLIYKVHTAFGAERCLLYQIVGQLSRTFFKLFSTFPSELISFSNFIRITYQSEFVKHFFRSNQARGLVFCLVWPSRESLLRILRQAPFVNGFFAFSANFLISAICVSYIKDNPPWFCPFCAFLCEINFRMFHPNFQFLTTFPGVRSGSSDHPSSGPDQQPTLQPAAQLTPKSKKEEQSEDCSSWLPL